MSAAVGSPVAGPPRDDRAGCRARPTQTGGTGVTAESAGQAGAGFTGLMAWLAGARDPLARWSMRRQIFAALLAEYEAGGHAVSPASWQRLKDDAARRAAAVLPDASQRTGAATSRVLPAPDGEVLAPATLAPALAVALPSL